MSIKTKILGWQAVLVGVACVLTTAVAYRLTVSYLRDCQLDKLTVIAQEQAGHISTLIDAKASMLRRIAAGQGISDYHGTFNDPALTQYLAKFAMEFPVLAYVAEDGREEVKLVDGKKSDQLKDVCDDELFQDALWERSIVHVKLSASSDAPEEAVIVFAMCRQSFFDEFEGLIMGRVPLHDVLARIRQTPIDDTGFLAVVDGEGKLLYHPRADKLFRPATAQGKRSKELLARIRTTNAGRGRATIEGIDGYVAYAPVEGTSWTVIATLPYKEFMAGPNSLRNTAILVSLAVLVACVAGSVLIASTITTGLSKLAAVTAALAKGDLSQRANLDSRDEVGALGKAFDNMASRLDAAVGKLNTEIADREQAQAELSKTNQQLRQAQSDLVQSEKMGMLGELAAGVAHEINTPAGAILNVSADSTRHLQEMVRLEMDISTLPDDTRQWLAGMLDNVPDRRMAVSESSLRTRRREVEKTLRECGVAGGRRLAEIIISYGLADTDYQAVLKHLAHEPVVAFLEHVAALKTAAEISASSAEKIARIVRALRFYSRDVQSSLVAVNVNQTIEDTLVILQNRIKHMAEIRTDVADELPPVSAGPELAQVWTNILSNACDAIEESTDEGMGLSEVATRRDGDHIVVSISNSGPPIPEADLSRVCDPFFTTKPIGKGTGLGLSICTGILQRCSGKIAARNEPGRVVFEVTLPVRTGDHPAENPETPPADQDEETVTPWRPLLRAGASE